ncbi:MAG: permease-like cell division protein FtsX [Cyclobacteriaceae bacterium]
MATSDKKVRKKKLGSYPLVSVVFSITISLFVIGLLGLMVIYSKGLTDLIRENVEIQVFLNKHITENEKIKLSKTFSSKDYVLMKDGSPMLELINKEDAAQQFIEETGEDFTEFIGENPLRDVLIIKINPDFHTAEKMEKVKSEIESERGVYEVAYVENLIDSINTNLAKISVVLGSFALILILIVVVLINNTIKLALFSQRFLIRSMQLVGATAAFIKRPFLTRAVYYGLISGLMASVMLFALSMYANTRIEDLSMVQNPEYFIILAVTLIVSGIMVGLLSTYRAINKYLKMSLDQLY